MEAASDVTSGKTRHFQIRIHSEILRLEGEEGVKVKERTCSKVSICSYSSWGAVKEQGVHGNCRTDC